MTTKTMTKETMQDTVQDPVQAALTMFDDDSAAHREASSRSFLSVPLEYRGEKLLPISAGSWELLRIAKNKLCMEGSVEQVRRDVAAFILLHKSDTRLASRRLLLADPLAFAERCYDWSDIETDADLVSVAPAITTLITQYIDTSTQSISPGERDGGSGNPRG